MKQFMIVLAIISLLVSPAWAISLGSQAKAEINFSDSVVTEAELDVVEQSFADPGIAPDSPLYIFKKFGEFIKERIARSKEEKARLHLQFAKTRLAEARYLMNKNKSEEALKHIQEYEEELNKTSGIGANVTVIAKDTEDVLLKSALVLELVKIKAPDEAKPALQRAINKSLERKARIKIEIEGIRRIKARETLIPAKESELRGETIPMPPTNEQIIESAVRKEIELEKERQRERLRSLEEIRIEISSSGSGPGSLGTSGGVTGKRI